MNIEEFLTLAANAVPAAIANNNIHDCSLGMWMDWQTQGTRITRNVFCYRGGTMA